MLKDLDKVSFKIFPNASKIIKDYSTNNLESNKLAFVDIQGRTIACCYHKSLDLDHSLLVSSSKAFSRLERHLEKYLFLYDAKISKLDHKVFFDTSDNDSVQKGEYRIHDKKGSILVTENTYKDEMTEESYRLYRVKNNLPEEDVDFSNEMLLNVFPDSYISFEKGCYLGQEILARVHFRGRPPKKIVSIKEGDCREDLKLNITSKCFDKELGDNVGFLFLPNKTE